MLTYHRTTEEEKYSITNWKYEGKYSIPRNPTRNIKETITALPTPKIISFPFMKMKTS